jgi:hypothetical protein
MRGPAIPMAAACVIVFLGCGAVCAQTTTPSIGSASRVGGVLQRSVPEQYPARCDRADAESGGPRFILLRPTNRNVPPSGDRRARWFDAINRGRGNEKTAPLGVGSLPAIVLTLPEADNKPFGRLAAQVV